ncbi:MaoC/PaaZ C-terminal domain-containing protein [Pseudomonadales bacterium]|nr:MaoC/PaaZ C-terminal domain-containing protein [Pseudomonadales bacterium]
MINNSKVAIASRIFSVEHQHDFARLSGDTNKMHLDPVYARRTIAGQRVVFGIFGLMWALESFISFMETKPSSIDVNFLKPIFLDEEVFCLWDHEHQRLEICNPTTVLTEVKIRFDNKCAPIAGSILGKPAFKVPFERRIDDLKKIPPQDFFFRGDVQLSSRMFPKISLAYGQEVCLEIAAISEIVGMQIPGLHSMLLALKIKFSESHAKPSFSIKKIHEKFNIVTMTVYGVSLVADVKALLRPKPTRGSSMINLKEKIQDDEFSKVRALIIGGSRGLGESVAKLIALGGGDAVITFASGDIDALNVVTEIRDFGGRCSHIKLKLPDDLGMLVDLGEFNQVYYFATPKIFGKRGLEYDPSLLYSFREIYVESFKKVTEHFNRSVQSTCIYYPSTVAIDEPINELAEYIDAKIEGEKLCSTLSGVNDTIVYTTRIPRTKTDQTLTVTYIPAVKPEDVMLPVIRKMMESI